MWTFQWVVADYNCANPATTKVQNISIILKVASGSFTTHPTLHSWQQNPTDVYIHQQSISNFFLHKKYH